MNKTDIKNIIYKNNGVSAVYHGINLIFKRNVIIGDNRPPKGQYILKGVIADSYNGDNIVVWFNNKKYSIVADYDKVNKTFYHDYSDEVNYEITSLQNFVSSKYFKKIDLSEFDTSDLTDATNMFYSDELLETINLGDYFSTKNITSIDGMFSYCSKLKELNIGNDFDLININKTSLFIFDGCSQLTKVKGKVSNIKCTIYLYGAPLDNDSIMIFINALNEVDKTNFVISASTYETLSEEQIALATSKGWSVIKQ